MKVTRIAVAVLAIFVTSCPLDTETPTPDPDPEPDPTPSLVRTWYTNPDDDRYYYDFDRDGRLVHRYYQYYGMHGGDLNGFVTKIGTWRYLDEDQTTFSVGWDDSVDRHYQIVEETATSLMLEADSNGPVGRGLSTTRLLKSATTIVFSVPDQIAPLMGIWYDEPTLEGRYLDFDPDGTLFEHYYQDYGGKLSGWVLRRGTWRYDTEDEGLTITMSGSASMFFNIIDLTTTSLTLRPTPSTPGSGADQDFYR